jgi:hypothetical protein
MVAMRERVKSFRDFDCDDVLMSVGHYVEIARAADGNMVELTQDSHHWKK